MRSFQLFTPLTTSPTFQFLTTAPSHWTWSLLRLWPPWPFRSSPSRLPVPAGAMEVTSDNFLKALPSILSAIDDASFVAIDGEFTGLSAFKGISAFDTIEVSLTCLIIFTGRPVNNVGKLPQILVRFRNAMERCSRARANSCSCSSDFALFITMRRATRIQTALSISTSGRDRTRGLPRIRDSSVRRPP